MGFVVMSAWVSIRPLAITPMMIIAAFPWAPTWARKHWIRDRRNGFFLEPRGTKHYPDRA